jgi:hypothetical protein
MTPRSLKLEPVEPTGHAIMLVRCPCGGMPGCPGLRQVLYQIPPADTAAAGMAFRVHRVNLGLPKTLAAVRLGITREDLDALERGLARCDWARARAALRFQERAEA